MKKLIISLSCVVILLVGLVLVRSTGWENYKAEKQIRQEQAYQERSQLEQVRQKQIYKEYQEQRGNRNRRSKKASSDIGWCIRWVR